MTTPIDGASRASACLSALALVALLAACGGGGSDDTTINYDNHQPMQLGDRWVYRERTSGGTFGTTTTILTETVIRASQIDGTPYQLIQTRSAFPFAPWRLQWYAASASGIRTSSGTANSPPTDRVRFPTSAGASFVQDYGPFNEHFDQDFDGKPDPINERLTTTTVGVETMSTPAGEFSGALHVREHFVSTTRMSATGTDTLFTTTLDTWYVPGVGQVRREFRYADGVTVVELMRHVPAGRSDPDTTPPTLVRVAPPSGAGAPLALTFNEPVTDFRAVTVTLDGNTVELGHFPPYDPEGRSVNLMPAYGWREGTYTVRFAEGIQDFAGNTMAALPDRTFTMPSDFALVSADPPRFGVDVDRINRPLSASMNLRIDPSTVTTIRLRENDVVVPATVSYDDYADVKVTPAIPLKPSTRYTVDLSGVRSDTGLSLSNPQEWTFTTAATLSARGLAGPLRQARPR